MADDNTDIYEKFNTAKAVILAASELKLFGCLIYKFNIVLQPGDFTAMVTIPLDTVSDGQSDLRKSQLSMIVSTEFVATKSITDLVYVLIHEITHVLNNHLSRGVSLDKEFYNLATDHVINTAIDNDIDNRALKGVTKPSDRIVINVLKGKNLTAEEVYEYLLAHATKSTQSFTIGDDNNDESNSDGNNDDSNNSNNDKSLEPNSEANSDSKSKESNKDKVKFEVTKTEIKLDDGQKFTFYSDFNANNGNASDTHQLEKELQSDVRRLLNSPLFNDDKRKGSKSGQLLELIKESIKVDIPWEDLLEHVIKTSITEISDNRSWKRVNKRMYNYNMILPSNELDETYDSLYIFVDTSGSVSSVELRKFVHIIRASMYHFKKVVKLDHDTILYTKHKIEYDASTINKLESDLSVEFTGRGGTSHREVYEFIEDLYINHYDEFPGLIILLTDFESDIDTLHKSGKFTFIKDKDISLKYIITSSRKFDIDPSIDPNPIFILPN